MPAVQVVVSPTLTIAAFTLLAEVTFLMEPVFILYRYAFYAAVQIKR